MPYMWADTLQAAERAHLLRLLAWAAASILCGTGLLALLRARNLSSALLGHFAIQSASWGVAIALFAASQLQTLAPRDVGSATRLDRMLWLYIGLDSGAVAVGLTLAALGWRMGRRMSLVGAGMGVIVQGCALALLDLILAGQISR
ncbi:hypothetical protein BH11GEM2_BH11GEM2_13040 [soil metagenome]